MTGDIEQLASRVAAGLTQRLTASASPALYRPLLRLLAQGEPVSTAELARVANRSEPDVAQAVADWADTEYDDVGRIVGYGLTLRPTPHRFSVGGHQLYTWCALDTLIFPAVLGQTAQVESSCRATGSPVRVSVHPAAGITELEPATAVVSIVTLEEGCASVRSGFCDVVHFFADREAAAGWLDEHPGISVLPVGEACRLGRPLIAELLDGGDPGVCRPS